jgi:hypothetical protein
MSWSTRGEATFCSSGFSTKNATGSATARKKKVWYSSSVEAAARDRVRAMPKISYYVKRLVSL